MITFNILKKIWDKLGEKYSDQRKQFTYQYFKTNSYEKVQAGYSI